MGFDRADIRTSMDVFTLDNQYLGTVLKVIPGPLVGQADPQFSDRALQTSRVNGELLGPMPTRPLGNQGPLSQSAAARYATDSDAEPLGRGAIVVGKWWGLVGKRTIALDSVQTISLERVVLRLRSSEL